MALGHCTGRGVGPSTNFMTGIVSWINLTYTGFDIADLDLAWNSLNMPLMEKDDMSYIVKQDFFFVEKFDTRFFPSDSDKQIIKDRVDAHLIDRGTNYLFLGDSIQEEEIDPIVLPNIGTVFKLGKYASRVGGLLFGEPVLDPIGFENDFTVEVWFRKNHEIPIPDKNIAILYGKQFAG